MQFYPTFDSDSIRSFMPAHPVLLPACSWSRQPRQADGGLSVPRIPPQVLEIAADSGGFAASMRAKRLGLEDGYTYTPEQYIAWLEGLGPRLSWAALFDWCCEPPVAGSRVSIRQRQCKTTEMAYSFWRRHKHLPFALVPTIQGWEVADYVWHARQLRPLIEEMAGYYGAHQGWRVGIGTLCKRASIAMIHAVCTAVASVLPDIPFHLWGVSLRLFRTPVALPGQVTSFDSSSWNRLFGREREAYHRSGLTQRRWTITVALPWYLDAIEQALAGPKQLSLWAPGKQVAHAPQAPSPAWRGQFFGIFSRGLDLLPAVCYISKQSVLVCPGGRERQDEMRQRERIRYDWLYEARELAHSGNWVVLDVETTSLEGEIIQWAVVAPDGTVLGQGFIHPTTPITEGARAIHGIADEQVADAPTFVEVWPSVYRLLAGKTIVAYNASFEEARLYTSASPYFSFLRGEPNLLWFCAMEAFAAAYGAWHDYFMSYTWQPLEMACHFFHIPHDQAHTAAGDASATAQLMHALVQMADEELPEGYHLPREVPCAGGCGQTHTCCYGESGDGREWYCGPCGVLAGVYHRCPHCAVLIYSADLAEWCPSCVVAEKLERGEYHCCAGCSQVVEAPERVQKYHNQTCQRRAARRRREQREDALPAGATVVRAGRHQLEAIHEGSARLRCTICQQTWTSGNVRSVCPGVPTFASWGSVPADRFVTWTELRRRHYTTSRLVPHAAVRIIKSPYYRYLYDLQRSTPVSLSPERQAAIAKAKATNLARYTCGRCDTYYASPDERTAFVAQVCKHCQREVRQWNQRVAWAHEMLQQQTVLVEVQMQRAADPQQSLHPVGCTVLDLASGTALRAGAIEPADAPALAALLDHHPTPVLTWDGEGLGTLRDWAQAVTGQWIGFGRMERLAGQLTHARQDERVIVLRERPYQNGSPADDLAWYCAAYGVEAGPMRLETMRRLVLHLAAQEPLVLVAPERQEMLHARTA